MLNSDIEVKDISYFLELKNWTHTGMEVQVNFTDPLLISKGELVDSVLVRARKRHLFVSQATGWKLEREHVYVSDLFPKQLPHGVRE